MINSFNPFCSDEACVVYFKCWNAKTTCSPFKGTTCRRRRYSLQLKRQSSQKKYSRMYTILSTVPCSSGIYISLCCLINLLTKSGYLNRFLPSVRHFIHLYLETILPWPGSWWNLEPMLSRNTSHKMAIHN